MNPFSESVVNELRRLPDHGLTAIVEMARLKTNVRMQLMERFSGWPLLQQRELENLREIGPWLFAPSTQESLQGQYDFLCDAAEMAGDAISAWLTSAMSPALLAEHLSCATTAQGPDGATYLLRFHTELAFPVLHARQDLPGIADWLAPVRHWWLVFPHRERKAWKHFTGHGSARPYRSPAIQLDESCWVALAGDPLAYRLADQLRVPLEMKGDRENCHGTRLGLVHDLLAQADRIGLSQQSDRIDYVTLMALQGKALEGSSAWNDALQEAKALREPLAQALQVRMRRKNG
ncbi:MAG: DUF4123 domain-containing protein [Achromobacter sp.]|uniref:DUF4123 domain-containing protein n=1 Tax=Achromobacter sp. TaxID=134375 RepID=UPI003D01C8F2